MNTTQPTHAEKQYLHTMTAGAWLPFAQSTGIAIVIGIGVWIIAGMVFDVMDPHKIALFFFAVSWVVMLIRLMTHWFSLTGLERIVNYDINNDGVIGETQPEEVIKPRKVVIQMDRVRENGHYQAGDTTSRVVFPCSDEQLYKFALGLVNGMPFTDRTWSQLYGAEKLFPEQQWREMKAAMFKKYGHGEDAEALIEYVNPENKKNGIRLTGTGKATMEEIANSPTPE